jgi:L-serine deaminase
MKETGRSLLPIYRETSEGGLAIVYRFPPHKK